MPIHPNVPQCTHERLGGRRCGSPAMSGEKFCYFHLRVKDATTQGVDSAISTVMLMEDAESVQGALIQIIDLTLKDQVSVPKSRVILRAIELGWKNLKEMHEQRKYDEEKEYRDTQRERWEEQDRKEAEKKREEEWIRTEKSREAHAASLRARGLPVPWEKKTEAAEPQPIRVEVGEINAVAEEEVATENPEPALEIHVLSQSVRNDPRLAEPSLPWRNFSRHL